MNHEDELLLFFHPQEPKLNFNNQEIFEENKEETVLYFTRWVEDLHTRGLTYLEAVANFVKVHDIEEEDITKFMTLSIKSKMYQECVQANMITKNDNDTAVLF